MSAQEIIAELPQLTSEELQAVQQHARELEQRRTAPPNEFENGLKPRRTWREALMEIAGTAEGLPADLAEQHDHYLHGLPKR